MTARAAPILDLALDAADAADAGLRAALDLHALAVAGLTAGPEARRAALGVLRWLDGGEGTEGPLDAALGMASPGRTHARQRLRRMQRDAALRGLWQGFCPDLSPTAAAALIAGRWRRYAAAGWRRHRDAGTEPADDPDATLQRLLMAGHDPLSADHLRRILAGAKRAVELPSATDDLRT